MENQVYSVNRLVVNICLQILEPGSDGGLAGDRMDESKTD
jgi:hypothetical protein